MEEAFALAAHIFVRWSPQYASPRTLARELVLLTLLAQRHDAGSAFATLPRDVVALIGRRVLADARDPLQHADWERAIGLRKATASAAASNGKASSDSKCVAQ